MSTVVFAGATFCASRRTSFIAADPATTAATPRVASISLRSRRFSARSRSRSSALRSTSSTSSGRKGFPR